ncbi:hypothetical protein VTJ83DRAFT_7087 [Remersonia thermophila]|uniref:Secreted protein n=1 Tax=Remersonia thermophila TaxID=72144 RepID=A0ABR4D2I6_9PEZI
MGRHPHPQKRLANTFLIMAALGVPGASRSAMFGASGWTWNWSRVSGPEMNSQVSIIALVTRSRHYQVSASRHARSCACDACLPR